MKFDVNSRRKVEKVFIDIEDELTDPPAYGWRPRITDTL